MTLFDAAAPPDAILHMLYNVGLGFAGISLGIFILVAATRARAFLKWRGYVDAGRPR